MLCNYSVVGVHLVVYWCEESVLLCAVYVELLELLVDGWILLFVVVVLFFECVFEGLCMIVECVVVGCVVLFVGGE